MVEAFWKKGDRVVPRRERRGKLAGTVVEVKAAQGQAGSSIGHLLRRKLKAEPAHELVKIRWDDGRENTYSGTDLDREAIDKGERSHPDLVSTTSR